MKITIFMEKKSFNTEVVMLRCFIKEIISVNVLFLIYWMLPLNSRIIPANVILPLKYLTKLTSTANHLITFYGHIEYTTK